MKYIIPIDVEVDLGEGIAFDRERSAQLLEQLTDDISDALCCNSSVVVDLANAENNASREWHLSLDWGPRGCFDPEAKADDARVSKGADSADTQEKRI